MFADYRITTIVHTCMNIYIYIYIYTHLCFFDMYIYIYIYIYIYPHAHILHILRARAVMWSICILQGAEADAACSSSIESRWELRAQHSLLGGAFAAFAFSYAPQNISTDFLRILPRQKAFLEFSLWLLPANWTSLCFAYIASAARAHEFLLYNTCYASHGQSTSTRTIATIHILQRVQFLTRDSVQAIERWNERYTDRPSEPTIERSIERPSNRTN